MCIRDSHLHDDVHSLHSYVFDQAERDDVAGEAGVLHRGKCIANELRCQFRHEARSVAVITPQGNRRLGVTREGGYCTATSYHSVWCSGPRWIVFSCIGTESRRAPRSSRAQAFQLCLVVKRTVARTPSTKHGALPQFLPTLVFSASFHCMLVFSVEAVAVIRRRLAVAKSSPSITVAWRQAQSLSTFTSSPPRFTVRPRPSPMIALERFASTITLRFSVSQVSSPVSLT